MSLETILAALAAEEKAQIAAHERASAAQIEAILAEANSRAAQVSQAVAAEVLSSLPVERARRMQQAKLAAVQKVGHAQEQAVHQVLTEVKELLATWREQPTYGDLLNQLLQQGVQMMASEAERGPFRLEADPRDRALLASAQTNFECQFTLKCWGGLLLKSADGRVSVDNTLESRFKQAVPYLRRELVRRYLLPDSDPAEA